MCRQHEIENNGFGLIQKGGEDGTGIILIRIMCFWKSLFLKSVENEQSDTE